MKGLNDTVIVKSKVHTSDTRGGVTTALTTKIASLVCSIQPIRREEAAFSIEGQEVIDVSVLMYENIISGPSVDPGDIIVDGNDNYIVLTVGTTSGIGTHSEAIIRLITNNSVKF